MSDQSDFRQLVEVGEASIDRCAAGFSNPSQMTVLEVSLSGNICQAGESAALLLEGIDN